MLGGGRASAHLQMDFGEKKRRERKNIPNIIYENSFIRQKLYSPLVGPERFFSSVILYIVGRIPSSGYQPVARLLLTHKTALTQNKCKQTTMSGV
jgi:hypothetical protein